VPASPLPRRAEIQAAPGQEILLPLNAAFGMDVGAISLSLGYPADKIAISGVFLGNDLSNPVLHQAANGHLRIGWHSLNPLLLKAGDPLVTIRITLLSSLNEGEIVRLTLPPDPLTELANGNMEVIAGAEITASPLHIMATGIGTGDPSATLSLSNYPNPFSHQTTFSCFLPVGGEATLELYTVAGQRLETLWQASAPAGIHTISVDASGWSAGVYFATLKVQNGAQLYTKTIRLINRK
jgi:hypothetical protein